MNIPANVDEIEVTFLLHMKTAETTPDSIQGQGQHPQPYDFFYFDLFAQDPENLLPTTVRFSSDKFECNNWSRCNPDNKIGGGVIHGTDSSGNPRWIKPQIRYRSEEFNNVPQPYVAFWANVDQSRGTVFFLDELKIKVTACQ